MTDAYGALNGTVFEARCRTSRRSVPRCRAARTVSSGRERRRRCPATGSDRPGAVSGAGYMTGSPMCASHDCDADSMTAVDVLHRLSSVIDEHRWSDLPDLLHRDFRCRLVHTGETFDRESWVRFNADYPGFQHFDLQDCIAEYD